MAKKYLSCAAALFVTVSLIGCSRPFAGSTDTTETTGNTTSAETTSEPDSNPDSDSAPVAEGSTSAEKDITLTNYYYTSKVNDVERCTGRYTDITFSKELQGKYPKLVETIDTLTENWESNIKDGVAQYAYWYDEELDAGQTFYNEQNISIIRFDERLFTIVQYDSSYAGGPHPNHSAYTHNLDPATGKSYTLADVLSSPSDFPATIRARMEKENPELLEEIDSFYYEDGDVFADKLTNETYSFIVDDSGLQILFSPYEVASYAAGSFEVNFSYDEYPDLVTEAFRMAAPVDMSMRIETVEGGTTEVEAKDIYTGEDYGELPSHDNGIEVSNPTWNYYFNDNYKKDTESHYLALTQTKEEPSDWLDTDAWALAHGFTVPEFPYEDENYRYEAYNPYMNDYMYNSVVISDANSGVIVADYNLGKVCNGYDDKENRSSDQTELIRYAKVVDDILYVEIGHMGYASEGPDNAYIVAIDMNTNEMIFRSEPLRANGYNFKVVDDTIICGYGFTAEPDYIYLLDRYTGKTVQQIPVRSAPYVFEIVGDTLYVATYNTAYEFAITK